MQWFTKAGFEDVQIKRIGPKWYRGVRRHGLIMGCSVTGVKRKVRGRSGASTLVASACCACANVGICMYEVYELVDMSCAVRMSTCQG